MRVVWFDKVMCGSVGYSKDKRKVFKHSSDVRDALMQQLLYLHYNTSFTCTVSL